MFTSERRRLRQRAGFTLSRLSRRAEVSESRLSEWERGENQLHPDEIMRVSVALAEELSCAPIPETAGDIFRTIEKFRVVRRGACHARAAMRHTEATA